MKVKLGQKVKDTVTGFSGTVVCRSEWLNGCARIIIQPPIDKDGKIPCSECIDENQLEIVEETKHKPERKTGGPRDDAMAMKRNMPL